MDSFRVDGSIKGTEEQYVLESKGEKSEGEKEVRNTISWLPKGTPKAIICVAHGIFEHGMCYDEMSTLLASNGYAVYAMDHRGHGMSSGKRGFVHDQDMFVKDYMLFTDMVRSQHSKDTPFFLFGHSMGSMITLAAAPQLSSVAGILISAFPADNGPGSTCLFGFRWLFWVSKLSIIPTIVAGLAKMDPDGDAAPLLIECTTSDESVRAGFANDPRRCTPMLKNKTADQLAILRMGAIDCLPIVTAPILFLHGADDEIGYPEGTLRAVERVGTLPENRNVKVYPGLRHEVINEVFPARAQVFTDILAFFDTRTKAVATTAAGKLSFAASVASDSRTCVAVESD
jgi:alpha-beta hydrolase superfamily lysophospholipase